MRCARTILFLPLLLMPAATMAQSGFSQARLEDDCLQRLGTIIPRDVKVTRVDFSALGTNAAYYVVSYGFAGDLATGKRAAACTYRRNGEWVKDDAAVAQWKRELDGPARR
jgi:hypothetical protein